MVHGRTRFEIGAHACYAEDIIEGWGRITVVLGVEWPLHVVAETEVDGETGLHAPRVVDERAPLWQRPVLIAGPEDLISLAVGLNARVARDRSTAAGEAGIGIVGVRKIRPRGVGEVAGNEHGVRRVAGCHPESRDGRVGLVVQPYFGLGV